MLVQNCIQGKHNAFLHYVNKDNRAQKNDVSACDSLSFTAFGTGQLLTIWNCPGLTLMRMALELALHNPVCASDFCHQDEAPKEAKLC